MQFQVAGVTEQLNVEARSPIVETSSTTVANTVTNAEIAKLPLAGRNILNFALLVPGTATSSGARDSEYNGLPGGAINITLDGVNNNSQRFRSGGTSFFVFAPIRLGAVEEVTISTAGLTAESGAEGAVHVQFTTKRGSNAFRGQVFDTIQSEKLNANSAVNNATGVAKNKLKQHEYGANIGGPLLRNKLFFFANYEQIYSPSENTQDRTTLTPEAQAGVFRYNASDNTVRTVNLLDIARANGLPSTIDPFVAQQFQTVNSTLGSGSLSSLNLVQNTFRFINEQIPNINYYPTARVDYQANSSLAIRGVLNLHYRDLPTNPQYPGLERWNAGFTSTYYIFGGGADWTISPTLFNTISAGYQSNFEEFNPGNSLAIYEPQGDRRVTLPLMTSPQITNDVMPIPRNNPVYNVSNTLTWLKGQPHVHVRRHVPPHDDVRGDRRGAAHRDRGARHRRSRDQHHQHRKHPRLAHQRHRHGAEPLRAARRTRQHLRRFHLLPRRRHEGVRTVSGIPPRTAERRRPLHAGPVAYHAAAHV